MNNLLMTLVLLTSLSVFANEKGNGGYIDGLIKAEMEDRKTLEEKDLHKLVENVGEELKNSTLMPLFRKFLSDKSKLKKPLREMRRYLKKNKEKLFLDIRLSHIKLGTCENGATTCTGSSFFSDIVIDKDAISKSTYGVSISDLIGLISHEYLHHFYADVPNHDDYILAKRMKEYILKLGYKEVTYTAKDFIKTFPLTGNTSIKAIYSFNVNYGPNALMIAKMASARAFCISKGHRKEKDYELGVLDDLSARELGLMYGGRKQFWRFDQLVTYELYVERFVWDSRTEKKFFKYITCYQ